ncbi:Lrp/AsnC family transcriptional regulator [Candidatus Woesearchaeota archaeon]|nr:Lrp/AsnC family transcriptional regulator [Candidatus Woesearchaeota archaeon]
MDNNNNRIKIDLKDNKILSLLHEDSRITLTSLGKQVRLSKDAVLYRINKLQKSGVIVKFYTDIDHKRLGFTKYFLFLQMKRLRKEEKELINNMIKLFPEIIFCAQCTENCDYWIEILSQSTDKFNLLFNNIVDSIKDSVDDYDILIETYLCKSYEPLIKQDHDYEIVKNKETNQEIIIDKKDYLILEAIENNSRLLLTDIVKKTGLTVDIIKYRFKRLKELKIINRCSVVLDSQKMRYELRLMIFTLKSFSKQDKERLLSYFIAHKNVRSVSMILGEKKILIEVLTKDSIGYLHFVNEIRSNYYEIFDSYEEMMIITEIKDNTLPYMTF